MNEIEITRQFIEKYKELEVYKENHDNIYCEYEKNNKNLFDSLRNIRNGLSHKTSNGEYPVFVNELFLHELEDMLRKMNKKITDCAIPYGSMYVASLDTKLSQVLKKMNENNYSYIPIVEDKVIKGVLTENSILTYIVQNNTGIIYDENTSVSELQDYITLDSNRNECFAFMSRNAFMIEAEEKFKSVFSKNKRLAVIYITETGKKGEKVLGMVTTFDILGNA